jgi:hypothetical protein
MRMRSRKYLWLAVTIVVAFAYARAAGDWSDVAFFAGMAGVIAVIVIAGNVFIELAPDGAFRRRPRT